MKSIKIFGARAKIETTYATPASPANTDAILLAENPQLAVAYANDGTRPPPPGTMGHQRRVAQSGRTGDTTLKFEPRGAGAAYSASVLPNINAMLRAAGFDAAIVTTPGTESVTYTPTPGPIAFGSVSLDLFARAQQYTMVGVYGDMVLGAQGPTVPLLEIPIKGLLPTIADAALPALVYGTVGSILPPKSVGVSLLFNALGGLRLKKWSLKMGRVINPRLDQNAAGGHAGFAIGMRQPMLELTLETEALATVDFFAERDTGTPHVISLGFGGTQYNRHNLTFPAAQVVTVVESAEDPVATVDVTCQLNPSAFGLNDEIQWQFN